MTFQVINGDNFNVEEGTICESFYSESMASCQSAVIDTNLSEIFQEFICVSIGKKIKLPP